MGQLLQTCIINNIWTYHTSDFKTLDTIFW